LHSTPQKKNPTGGHQSGISKLNEPGMSANHTPRMLDRAVSSSAKRVRALLAYNLKKNKNKNKTINSDFKKR